MGSIDIDRLKRWANRVCDTTAGDYHDGYEEARTFVRNLLDNELPIEVQDDED